MSWKTYPKQKEKLLSILTEAEIGMLKKDYPFREERNAKICELRRRGISCAVLMELTGLCKNSILQISQFGGNRQFRIQDRADDLIKIKTAFDVLYREIKKLLKQRRS
jgi:hypothetical protein